jgi:hypothetical protein
VAGGVIFLLFCTSKASKLSTSTAWTPRASCSFTGTKVQTLTHRHLRVAAAAAVASRSPCSPGTQFTCFVCCSTKIQVLTPRELAPRRFPEGACRVA